MGLIADILLVAGALGATLYCFVLSRRLAKFNDLERGVGGAVAVLSVQVDDMTKTLKNAQISAQSSANSLQNLTGRAEGAARKLELLVASMHDLPEPPPVAPVKDSGNIAPEPPAPTQQTAQPNATQEVSETAEAQSGDASGLLFLRHPVSPQEAAE